MNSEAQIVLFFKVIELPSEILLLIINQIPIRDQISFAKSSIRIAYVLMRSHTRRLISFVSGYRPVFSLAEYDFAIYMDAIRRTIPDWLSPKVASATALMRNERKWTYPSLIGYLARSFARVLCGHVKNATILTPLTRTDQTIIGRPHEKYFSGKYKWSMDRKTAISSLNATPHHVPPGDSPWHITVDASVELNPDLGVAFIHTEVTAKYIGLGSCFATVARFCDISEPIYMIRRIVAVTDAQLWSIALDPFSPYADTGIDVFKFAFCNSDMSVPKMLDNLSTVHRRSIMHIRDRMIGSVLL